MKKKIAIVTGSLLTGGAESMVAQLAIKIDKDKYDVIVICIYISVNSPVEQLLIKNDINVIFLNKKDGPDINTFMKLGKILNKFKPDVVHTHLSGAIYSYPWLLFHQSKMIHTLHTLPEKEFSPLTRSLLRFFYKTGKAFLVTVSPENKLKACEYYSLPSSKIKMVYNPVDIKRYYKTVENKDDFVFINVGRQDTNKNQSLIIKSFAKLLENETNIKLFLIGDGNQHQNLINLAKSLSIENKVLFTGIVGNPEDFLARSDVYIQSSHYEGLPLAILEAMAAKLPIISTDVGGVRDVISNNGILIPDNDMNSLVQAMKKLMIDTQLLKEQSNNSYNNVQLFDSNVMAQKYCELYEEICND